MTALLARLRGVRLVRERQALAALARTVRAATANRALSERVAALLPDGASTGSATGFERASAAAGREQLRQAVAVLAERQAVRDADSARAAGDLAVAVAAVDAVERRLTADAGAGDAA